MKITLEELDADGSVVRRFEVERGAAFVTQDDYASMRIVKVAGHHCDSCDGYNCGPYSS